MDLLSLKDPEASSYTRPVRVQKRQPIPNVFLKTTGLVCPTFRLKILFFLLGYGTCLCFDSIMKKSMKGEPDHLLTGCMTSLQQRQIFRLLARVQEVS